MLSRSNSDDASASIKAPSRDFVRRSHGRDRQRRESSRLCGGVLDSRGNIRNTRASTRLELQLVCLRRCHRQQSTRRDRQGRYQLYSIAPSFRARRQRCGPSEPRSPAPQVITIWSAQRNVRGPWLGRATVVGPRADIDDLQQAQLHRFQRSRSTRGAFQLARNKLSTMGPHETWADGQFLRHRPHVSSRSSKRRYAPRPVTASPECSTLPAWPCRPPTARHCAPRGSLPGARLTTYPGSG
jgi:hypothetical protein